MNPRPGQEPTRHAFTLLEVVISSTLLAAVLIVSARMVWTIARQRQAILDRQTALAEAGNQMERLFARPWDRLSNEAVRDVRLSDDFQGAFPGARLSIEISGLSEELAARRIFVKVSWIGDPSRPARSVQLVALRYRSEPANVRVSAKKQGELAK